MEKQDIIRIKAGEYHVTGQDVCISTVLGSCISACIRDPLIKVGGMNHFMLPSDGSPSSSGARAALHGGYAMEILINELLKLGAQKHRLEIKVFGGANVIDVSTEVGTMNIRFVTHFLANEGFAVAGQDVGGDCGRSLRYYPVSGKAMVKPLPRVQSEAVEREELSYSSQVNTKPEVGTVELF